MLKHTMSSMKYNRYELFSKGFTILHHCIDPLMLPNHIQTIRNKITQHTQTLKTSEDQYLTAVSRWLLHRSDLGFEQIYEKLNQILKELVNQDILVKSNLITKNEFANAELALHQDISYSPTQPYEYSAWLALTDSPLNSGTLCVVPGSHLNEIEEAVDFWSPLFEKRITGTAKISLAVCAGDVIVFDSRLWHGSDASISKYHRFALVTRWKSINYIPPKIPPIKPLFFGMWHCHQQTKAILREAAKIAFDVELDDFLELLHFWKKSLEKGFLYQKKLDEQAIHAISLVEILHCAHVDHQGGDAQGVIYLKLWHQCLFPIQEKLNIKIV